jgi:small subunit ribosomal protein S1
VHISELSSKHVEHADQVVTVNQDVFVKLIDIDLERRRISLSLKQALEEVDPNGSDFNPVLYGMSADYDEQGQYRYPEGFDPATNEWKSGYEEARSKWEAEYAEAHARWELHKVQAKATFEQLATLPDVAPAQEPTASSGATADQGTLADDESLAALRDKLAGGN